MPLQAKKATNCLRALSCQNADRSEQDERVASQEVEPPNRPASVPEADQHRNPSPVQPPKFLPPGMLMALQLACQSGRHKAMTLPKCHVALLRLAVALLQMSMAQPREPLSRSVIALSITSHPSLLQQKFGWQAALYVISAITRMNAAFQMVQKLTLTGGVDFWIAGKVIEWVCDSDQDGWKTLGPQEDELPAILGAYNLSRGDSVPIGTLAGVWVPGYSNPAKVELWLVQLAMSHAIEYRAGHEEGLGAEFPVWLELQQLQIQTYLYGHPCLVIKMKLGRPSEYLDVANVFLRKSYYISEPPSHKLLVFCVIERVEKHDGTTGSDKELFVVQFNCPTVHFQHLKEHANHSAELCAAITNIFTSCILASESSCYRGANQALKWDDIEVHIVSSPEDLLPSFACVAVILVSCWGPNLAPTLLPAPFHLPAPSPPCRGIGGDGTGFKATAGEPSPSSPSLVMVAYRWGIADWVSYTVLPRSIRFREWVASVIEKGPVEKDENSGEKEC
ncbi:hypothetical protein F5146DRAFT_994597 [Armillaria mellea]|nr:hypothetical protein F5146DRAFT_994597 [Armillaria mellea]